MTGPRPSSTRCAKAGSRCRRIEVIAKADAGPSGPADAPPDADATSEVTSAADLAARLVAEARTVKGEVDEIDLLINQARTEAARHETRRSAASEKLAMAVE